MIGEQNWDEKKVRKINEREKEADSGDESQTVNVRLSWIFMAIFGWRRLNRDARTGLSEKWSVGPLAERGTASDLLAGNSIVTVSRTLALPGASLMHPSPVNLTSTSKASSRYVFLFLCVWLYGLCISVCSLFVLLLSAHGLLGIFSFTMSSFVSHGGAWGCIWAMLPGALVKLEQSLQVISLRRPDNTLYHTLWGEVKCFWRRPTFNTFCDS